MSINLQLDTAIQDTIAGNIKPLVIHESGTVKYIIYPITQIGEVTGYPVIRITEPTESHSYIDKALVLESDRVAGANSSGADVNLKGDQSAALALLTYSEVIYG